MKINAKFNKKMILALIVGVFIGSLGSFGISNVFGENAKMSKMEYYKNLEKRYAKLYELDRVIESSYYKPVDKEKLYTSMYKGLFKGLDDPYSEYMTKEEYAAMLKESADNYVGTGTLLQKSDGNVIKIEEVFAGGPAKAAGVKKGDILLKVDGKAYGADKITEASAAMRGVAGTKVVITIKQADTGNVRDFEITRREIESTSVYGNIIDGVNNEKIGYIRIQAFHERVARDFKKKYLELKKDGAASFIIDLRNNLGGYVDEAMEVADDLLPKGVICYAKDNMGQRQVYKSKPGKIKQPYVILLNEFSASASEMLAAGVKDTKSGVIIGTKSYGKGIIQSTLQFPGGDGIKLTTMEYFSPKGNSIHKKGIVPDIEIANSKDDTVDRALEKAKDVLGGK